MRVEEYRRASEVLQEQSDFGADWTLEDVQEDFVLRGFEVLDTMFGPAARLECWRDGVVHYWITWSKVVIDQLHQLEDALPVVAHVEKRKGERGTYLTLV